MVLVKMTVEQGVGKSVASQFVFESLTLAPICCKYFYNYGIIEFRLVI